MGFSTKKAHVEIPESDTAMYSTAETARLVGLSATRVGRWLQGYEYVYDSRVRQKSPVIRRAGTLGTSYASFLDLVDLLFVKRFLVHGLSLQKVRKALLESEEILGTSHFARESFFTDGRKIYLQVRGKGKAILQLLSGGQWVIAPIIQQLARQIEFERSTGLARRWYPKGHNGLIVLDPLVSFGRPSIAGKGIATTNIFDLYNAERENISRVCSWMNVSTAEAAAAVSFEKELAA
jgi:uncharacterized protein (DUF433 family)